MPDYTLKVKLDVGELERQLSKAFQKTPLISLLTSGTGSTGGRPASGAEYRADEGQKKILAALQLMQRTNEKSERVQQKGWMGKFGPSLMKIAGITMGLAALRQVGMALVDASPLLQSMAKIGTTAFTLFLRPLGDFIGFLLRPFVILMLKHAIKFYKLFGGPNAAKAAEQTFAATGITPGLTEDEVMDARVENLKSNLKGLNDIFDWLFGKYNPEDIPSFIPTAGATPPPQKTPEEIIQEYNEKYGATAITDAEKIALEGTDSQNLAQDMYKDMMDYFNKMSAKLGVSTTTHPWLEPQAGVGDTGGGGVFEQWQQFLGNDGEAKTSLTESEANMLDMSAQFGNIAHHAQLAEQDTNDGAFSLKNIAQAYVNARRDGKSAQESISVIADTFQQAEERILSLLKTLSKQRKSDGSRTASAKMASNVLAESGEEGLLEAEDEEGGGIQYEPIFKPGAAIGTVGDGKSHNGWKASNFKIYATKEDAIANSYLGYDVRQVVDGKVMRYGGIINEPVHGIGMFSGKPYSFGEAGAEKVTPISGRQNVEGTGDTFQATFYVSGVNTDDFEAKVKPMVMRWLKESKSNRGIL